MIRKRNLLFNNEEFQIIRNDFIQKSNQIINDILGKNAAFDQKELIDILTDILDEHTRKYYNLLQIKQNTIESNALSNNLAQINIFLLIPPSNLFNYPNYYCPQQKIIPYTANSYNSYYSIYQMPIFQPNFYNFNQQPILDTKFLKKNIKSKSKSKHKKSDKKSKTVQSNEPFKSLKKSKKSQKINDSNSKILTFDHREGQDLNGIINYLTEKTGGNINDNGTIEIIANSHYKFGDYGISHIVDYNNHNWYSSESVPNVTVTFDFKERKIQLNCYVIKSVSSFNSLKNWVIEISDDGTQWDEVDRRENDPTFGTSKMTAAFSTKKSEQFCRFIRLRQTGKNWKADNYSTNIAAIEFYGKLKSKKD